MKTTRTAYVPAREKRLPPECRPPHIVCAPMTTSTLLQDTIDFDAPAGTGDPAVLHQALVFFLRHQLGATRLPVAPNLDEQRKMLPLLEGFAKAMLLCASGDGELAPSEREWILGFSANAGATDALLQELRTLDPRTLDPFKLLQQTERPGLFVHALIYHAIKASDADGVLEPREVQTIRTMAMLFQVPPAEVDGLFELHAEEKAFQERKMARLFPNGHPWA
jgi:tellurite resistance protein